MVFLALLLLPTVAALYSIHYSAKNNHPEVIGQARFASTPSATQVADIYARVSGNGPLLSEAQGALPSINILQKSNGQPIILNLIGGEVPSTLTQSIVTVDKNDKAPSVVEIQKILKKNNIHAEAREMINPGNTEISNWIAQQERPVFILHQEAEFSGRKLQTGDNSSAPLSEEEISSYQIALWTGVLMFLLLLTGVCTIVGMDVVPDSLLFAKFQSSRTNKSD